MRWCLLDVHHLQVRFGWPCGSYGQRLRPLEFLQFLLLSEHVPNFLGPFPSPSSHHLSILLRQGHVRGCQVMVRSLLPNLGYGTFVIVDVLHWHGAECFAFLHEHEGIYFQILRHALVLLLTQKVGCFPLQLLQLFGQLPLLSRLLF